MQPSALRNGRRLNAARLTSSLSVLVLLAGAACHAADGYSISGKVTVLGLPLEGASVHFDAYRNFVEPRYSYSLIAITGPDGAYRLEVPLAVTGYYWAIYPTMANGVRGEYRPLVTSTSYENVNFNYENHSISGKVTLEGVPLEEATVHFSGYSAIEPYHYLDAAITGPDGAYRFDVPFAVTGSWSVWATTANGMGVQSRSLWSSQNAENVDLNFVMYSITGKVTLEGVPLEGATVTYSLSPSLSTAITGPDGTYRFDAPKVANRVATVWATMANGVRTPDRYVSASLSVANVDFNFENHSIGGKVTLNGVALEGAALHYERDPNYRTAITGPDGAYRFDYIQPGLSTFWATTAKAMRTAKLYLNIPPSLAGVNFDFRTVNISGKAIDEDTGAAVSGATIQYVNYLARDFSINWNADSTATGAVLSSADGSFNISVVIGLPIIGEPIQNWPEGRLTLTVSKPSEYEFDSDHAYAWIPPDAANVTNVTLRFSKRKWGTLAWGSNVWGGLGNVTWGPNARPSPTRVVGLRSGVLKIAAGVSNSLALTRSGEVWAWGMGWIGDGSNGVTPEPIRLDLTEVVDVAVGTDHSLAVRKDGTVWAWGWNGQMQLGDGTQIDRSRPVQVIGLSGVKAVSAGVWHSMALKEDGSVWIWGTPGDHGGSYYLPPTQVPIGDSPAIAISSGGSHHLVLKADGVVMGWGSNRYGELGLATTSRAPVPIPTVLPAFTGITMLSAGAYSTLALRADGSVWASGSNATGQLGDGTTTDRTLPVQVQGLPQVHKIACGPYGGALAGGFTSLALTPNGEVWAWGGNGTETCGDGTLTHIRASDGTQYYVLPIKVKGVSGRIGIAAGGVASYAWGDPPKNRADFDGDGNDDILLRHPSSGEVRLWLMK